MRLNEELSGIAGRLEVTPLINIREREARAYVTLIDFAAKLVEGAPSEEQAFLQGAFAFSIEKTSLNDLLAIIDLERKEQEELFRRLIGDLELSKSRMKLDLLFAEGWRFELRDFQSTRILSARCATFSAVVCEAEEVCLGKDSVYVTLQQLISSIGGNRYRRSTITDKRTHAL